MLTNGDEVTLWGFYIFSKYVLISLAVMWSGVWSGAQMVGVERCLEIFWSGSADFFLRSAQLEVSGVGVEGNWSGAELEWRRVGVERSWSGAELEWIWSRVGVELKWSWSGAELKRSWSGAEAELEQSCSGAEAG